MHFIKYSILLLLIGCSESIKYKCKNTISYLDTSYDETSNPNTFECPNNSHLTAEVAPHRCGRQSINTKCWQILCECDADNQ